MGNFWGINFRNTEPNYWAALMDKTSGLLWEVLLSKNHGVDDKQLLSIWLSKILVSPGWPQPLLFTTRQSTIRFLNAAFELVINEPDIDGIENEFAKVCMDEWAGHSTLQSIETTIKSGEFTLNGSDIFELLTSFNTWEEKANRTYLYNQGSRKTLAFLVYTLVNYDSESNNEVTTDSAIRTVTHFHRLISLLHASNSKPYLVWEITRFIILYRPEVIPYLIIEPGLKTLSFIFLDDINLFREQKSVLNLELWNKSTSLLLHSLSVEESQAAAKMIFQLYRSLNKNKYEIPYNRSNKKLEIETKENHDKKESVVLGLIENYKLYPNQHMHTQDEFLLPTLYEDLSAAIINYSSKPLYFNGTVQFPIIQWDAMSWLLRASTYWKYNSQKFLIKDSADRLTSEFLNRYLESIEVTEINKFNQFEGKEEIGIPLWSEKIERLQFIDWIYPIYLINTQGNLNMFLSPRIAIERTPDKYHKKNSFSADKLRTHIGVLLQVLRKLLLPVIPYSFQKDQLKSIKNKIEKQLIDLLRMHIKDLPKQGRIDLFSYNKEWQYQTTDIEALFPQIARAINWFSEKDAVINVISESGDINKLLTLLEHVKSEGVKQNLLDKIKELDVQSFLETYNWIPEVQNTVSNLSKYPELITQIEQAIVFWKQRIMTSREDPTYNLVLYKAELLVAYFKKSEQLIDAVIEPKVSFHGQKELQIKDYKKFYKGLLYILSKPADSHSIFNSLLNQYPSYPSFALNRMVAKINLAISAKDNNLYQEALEEWKEAAKEFETDAMGSLNPKISESIMTILCKTGEHEALHETYRNLDLPDRMRPTILEILVDSLLTQNKVSEALQIISAAKTYHQFSDILDLQFVIDLEKSITTIDNVEELKHYYNRIFMSEPGKLIRIFPENLNGRVDLSEFMVKEIILAADKLLDKIMSISEIASEDKYNDLIELALDARINPWGWQVGPQSRAAFSGTGGKQPGERDLPIMNQFKRTFMVCEAFIYRDSKTAKDHLKKVFNYHHNRNSFCMLIYDLSKNVKGFQKHWQHYVEKILPSTSFPLGHEIKGSAKDVCKDFGFENSAIKICSSEHQSGTLLYHVFINLNYKL
ncbi:hypothetical protein IQ13_4204 [Lacibacter cauensis]|uniref:Uncharacterized protein n=1 Tax=Lacibacter cauensis TaxID=510947 RepID=A0A562S9C6_9BACT|nr:hypothetical protein [Lacibacter cauensis]TWI77962.1 hypothetical protein IQ13_4204 [Lacibacter cauensis]